MTVEDTHCLGIFYCQEAYLYEFFFQEKELLGHPCVYKVDRWKLTLTCRFRIELYEAWKPQQSAAEIAALLMANGLTPDLVGTDYHITLANGFKGSGYPISNRTEASSIKDYVESNPIVLSGKFVRSEHGNGIAISPKFKKELLSNYPDVSVEEGLRQAGLDPVDVGYQRINRIQKELAHEQTHICHKQIDEFLSMSTTDFDDVYSDESDSISVNNLENHPYIKEIRYDRIVLKDCFYNECYMLYPLGMEKILNIYELTSESFTEKNKIAIGSRLYHWNKNDCEIEPIDEQILRIQISRTQALNDLVKSGFAEISSVINKMGVDSRRKLCRWISELPRDVTGYYTTAAVRNLIGISKSTYYALLNNEDYGSSSLRKNNQDELDIEAIRQVLAYKGFEKGIRQVYMLMPKVAGKQFSIYRIRRLMNKYGIRTTIRRPSRNRKAMKDLIARNKKANLLMRKFKLHRPNEVRLTDVTYLDYGADTRAYGSASIDPVTGRLICFIISENNDLKLALDTLEAMDAYPAKSGAILHSDQGILYMTDDFQAVVIEKELTQSMSRRGNCWDNAVQESFFGHFKDECHYEKCKSFEELQKCIDEYSDYYNNERGMWDKGGMTPVEYEKYLSDMDDEAFSKYLAEEEKRYLEMKEKAAAKAVQDAKDYKAFIEESMEALN